jgi:hypothetical protein
VQARAAAPAAKRVGGEEQAPLRGEVFPERIVAYRRFPLFICSFLHYRIMPIDGNFINEKKN